MSESATLYKAVVDVTVGQGPDKHVRLPVDGTEIVMGMSGGLADFYAVPAGSFVPRASTLDYVVGAATACLLGTFRRALVARRVTLDQDDLVAHGTGFVSLDGEVPLLREILVNYRLRLPEGTDTSAVQRAHDYHHRACAVSRSLEAAITMRTELEVIQR